MTIRTRLQLARRSNIHGITVEGDLECGAREICSGPWSLADIKKVLDLVHLYSNVSFNHVLCKANQEADILAKQGVSCNGRYSAM